VLANVALRWASCMKAIDADGDNLPAGRRIMAA
jgi:hypothetical protein